MVEIVETGIKSMQRKQRQSVQPETNTVCPCVASMTATASWTGWPALTSSLNLAVGETVTVLTSPLHHY